MEILLILSPILGGFAAALGIWWLERFTKHAGLGSAIAGTVMVLVGGIQLFMRPGMLPAVFVVQGILFFGYYHSRRSSARAAETEATGR